MYLEKESVEQMLRFVTKCKKGSSIVFDYCLQESVQAPNKYYGAKEMLAYAKGKGEPYKTSFHSENIVENLSRLGLKTKRHYTSKELQQQYLQGYNGHNKLAEIQAFIHAHSSDEATLSQTSR